MPRQPLSPLASELRDTIRQLGPCSGLEAWEDIARRIEVSRRLERSAGTAAKAMAPDIGDVPTHVDRHGRVQITRAALEAALLECEVAGGLGCRNLHSSDADQVFSWRPLPPDQPAERQGILFE